MPLHPSRQLERRILQALGEHPEGLSVRQLKEILGEPVGAGSMNYLRGIGRIVSAGRAKGSDARTWRLNE